MHIAKIAALTLVVFVGPTAAHALSVKVAPPAVRVEVRPAKPSGAFVWAPGYWARAQGAWAWTAGTWVPAHPRYRHYVGATWVRTGDRWVFRSGGYAVAPRGKVRVVHRPRAPGVVKVRPAKVKHHKRGHKRKVRRHHRRR